MPSHLFMQQIKQKHESENQMSKQTKTSTSAGVLLPEAITTVDMRQPDRIVQDRRLLQLARFPEMEPGVTLEFLLQQTSRRSLQSVWESVTILIALGYLEVVTLSDGSIGFVTTELAVEREGFLPAAEIMLVRLPSEAMAMRFGQLVALTGFPEDEVRAKLSSLARRGLITKKKDRKEGLIICPTLPGLREAGFNRAYYQTQPARRGRRHILAVSDVRVAQVEEFVTKDSEGRWEMGDWQHLSERMRSRVDLRTERHMPDSFWVHGRDFSLANEIALSNPETDQLEATMMELSRNNTEVRYYTDNDEARNKIARTLDKLEPGNVKLLDMPKGPSSPSA
jgi:hypothetical protein